MLSKEKLVDKFHDIMLEGEKAALECTINGSVNRVKIKNTGQLKQFDVQAQSCSQLAIRKEIKSPKERFVQLKARCKCDVVPYKDDSELGLFL